MKAKNVKKSRGRKALLWAAVLFCLAQVVVDVVVDGWRPQLRSSYLYWLCGRIRSCSRGPDVVGLGTSRFGSVFAPEVIQPDLRSLTGEPSLQVFNASIAAQDYISGKYVLEQFLKQGKTPSLVVIEVCPEMVARRNLWLGQHVMPRPTWQNLSDYADALYLSSHLPGLLGDRVFPLYRCRREIREEALATWTRCCAGSKLPGGSTAQPQTGSTADRPEKAEEMFLDTDASLAYQARVEVGLRTMRQALADYRVGGLSALALENVLKRCRRRGITVILVAPPVSSQQRQLYTPAIEDAFHNYLGGLIETYHCSFIDCRSWLPDRLFCDNHHVVRRGGAVFSRQLAREVLAPAWELRKD